MLFLRNRNQTLERFERLRTVFVIYTAITIVLNVSSTKLNEDSYIGEWVFGALEEINALFVFLSVAYMWRPNQNMQVSVCEVA